MAIHRAPRPNSNFYILNKTISEDKSLTWAARGMLVFLLGKPDNWVVSVQALINETAFTRKQSGRDAVYGILAELKDAGYLRAMTARSEGGVFGGVDYAVCETPSPLTENPGAAPLPGLPDTAQPLPANPTLTRTDKKQELKPTKDATGALPLPEGFAEFWGGYPNRGAKQDAIKAFKQVVTPKLLPTIMAALEVHKCLKQWTKDDGSYVPLAASWLRGKRWEDEIKTVSTAGNWWETQGGLVQKANEIGMPAYTGQSANDWVRWVAAIWVKVGDGPHWDRDSSVYPVANSLRSSVAVGVSSLLDTLDLGVTK